MSTEKDKQEYIDVIDDIHALEGEQKVLEQKQEDLTILLRGLEVEYIELIGCFFEKMYVIQKIIHDLKEIKF